MSSIKSIKQEEGSDDPSQRPSKKINENKARIGAFLNEIKKVIDKRTDLIHKKSLKDNYYQKNMEEEPVSKGFKAKITKLLIQSSKEPDTREITVKVEDDLIHRRFANYIPLKSSIFSEDTLQDFYPNFGDENYSNVQENWDLTNIPDVLRHTAKQDLILYEVAQNFSDVPDYLEIYKRLNKLSCNTAAIKRLTILPALLRKVSRSSSSTDILSIAVCNQPTSEDCSIKIDESLNEETLFKTHKELFCERCQLYDCNHGLLDFYNFLNPSRFSTLELDQSRKMMHDQTKTREKLSSNPKKPCSDGCFLNLSEKEQCEFFFQQTQQTLSEFDEALIGHGVQLFKFEPCKIVKLFTPGTMTCAQIYTHLYSKYMIPRHNNKDDQIAIGHDIIPTASARPKKGSKGSKSNKRNFFPNFKNVSTNTQGNFYSPYKPCYHSFTNQQQDENKEDMCDNSCECFQRSFCDKYCMCDHKKCKIMRKGCECAGSCFARSCLCYSLNCECDPDICKKCYDCGPDHPKRNKCRNNAIYFGTQKRCVIGPSEVCNGLGLFNVEPIYKEDFVSSYVGELISWEEAEMREKWNSYDKEVYIFCVTDERVIDAKYKGNKSRFMNHSSVPNIVPRNILTQGEYHIAFFATEFIPPGTELFFDYDGGKELWKHFDWITKKPKNKKKPTKQSDLEDKPPLNALLPKKVVRTEKIAIGLPIDVVKKFKPLNVPP